MPLSLRTHTCHLVKNRDLPFNARLSHIRNYSESLRQLLLLRYRLQFLLSQSPRTGRRTWETTDGQRQLDICHLPCAIYHSPFGIGNFINRFYFPQLADCRAVSQPGWCTSCRQHQSVLANTHIDVNAGKYKRVSLHTRTHTRRDVRLTLAKWNTCSMPRRSRI